MVLPHRVSGLNPSIQLFKQTRGLISLLLLLQQASQEREPLIRLLQRHHGTRHKVLLL
jgi:hypothetical protein